ncbi:2-oxoglutarate dehydrogenase complex dihydrolipoyllysine-residue succinyltransferase [Candidatus Comchoanobacter bicostacola]|uniref:Dihydrolipoyllysine-residue succinyltransferase n=1 Tax=Candidatus Comchoanobacter bicostacola TaxID=2919598 RepID=A0ABY5DML9_9GAMM|nr:2-oxoglutarate dehydrogenase complex dihydrolipoyllysine-residue succinyltransferase [Candidatus Comchoanobacter bicostacola]UTC24882.1 2-oxoglutarate dehydrogenase complex dihydrolipoyllysine-residue succinyltransferase [Candidatus Comchoanobacter bicostacola]
MSLEIKTPMLPESVTSATVAVWHKSVGDSCCEGDVVVELETDKVMLEVTATTDGVMAQQMVPVGSEVTSDQVLALLSEGSVASVESTVSSLDPQEETVTDRPLAPSLVSESSQRDNDRISPSERRRQYEVGKPDTEVKTTQPRVQQADPDDVDYMRKPMSGLRKKIAQRLVEATQETAMLTTFNEVIMDPIISIRSAHQSAFQEKHGVKLGFMSFFVQAVAKALEDFPEINASIDGNDILYHSGKHIGIAVSTDRGLVVPVLRDVQDMSYAHVEQCIVKMAKTARAGKLTLDQMQGGTFTITNGGVFGSMLSTPILNMPQSAILGMHAIQKRAVVIDDAVVIRSMMYLALSYDHRLVDGQQSVQFLVRIKQILEDPDCLLLDL